MNNVTKILILILLVLPAPGFAAARQDPISFFQEYWDAWIGDATAEELLEYMSAKRKAKIEDIPPFIRTIAINFKMNQIRETVRASEIRSINQEKQGKAIYLRVETIPRKDYAADIPQGFIGKITIVEELGEWKIDKESWHKQK